MTQQVAVCGFKRSTKANPSHAALDARPVWLVESLSIHPENACGEHMNWHYRTLLNTSADAKHMAIWMSEVHFSNVPRHVGRWKGYFKIRDNAFVVNRVHIFHPH